jgi:hypothetical protein
VRLRARALARASGYTAARRRPGRLLGSARESPWLRRGVLLAVLLVVAFVPYPTQSAPALVAATGCRSGCHPAEVNMFRWSEPLPGQWDVDNGLDGTVPAGGPAYAAAADGVAVLGSGLTLYAYQADNGQPMWTQTLTGFPAGAAIVSVRSWPDEVTAGVSYLGKGGVSERAEVVIPDTTGVQSGQYGAALFGGAVAATSTYTVIVGQSDVTSYDNASGKVRWHLPIGDVVQGWQVDGQYLYVAESAGGDLSDAPVTALRRIDTATGVEQQVLPQPGAEGGVGAAGSTLSFDGTLDGAFDGVVLFSAASGVTAYSGLTGIELWSVSGTVPEGADPEQNEIYLARGTTLLAVSPVTGRIVATAPGLGGGMYVVRNGVALGLDPGSDSAAWGYDIGAERVALSASGFGWPHYFADLSGVGGSTDPDGDLVIIAACAQAGQPVSAASPSGQGSPGLSGSPSGPAPPSSTASATVSPSPTPAPSPTVPAVQPCLRPELIALGL